MYKIAIVQLATIFAVFATCYCQFLCSCDLYRNVCETNCCCDNDCISIQHFSECKQEPAVVDSTLCTYKQVDYFMGLVVISTVSNGNFFCVQTANLDRSSYISKDCAAESCFADLLTPQYSYVDKTSAAEISASLTSYVIGDSISVEYNNGIAGSLSVPAPSGISNVCSEDGVVEFLRSSTTICTRTASSVNDICSSVNVRPETYYDGILVLPTPSSSELLNISLDLCTYYGANSTCPVPTYNTTTDTCYGAVSSVTYTILVNGSGFIQLISSAIALKTVQSTDLPLQQRFTVDFVTAETNDTSFEFSGMPGYIVGKPLRAAVFPTNSSASMNVDPSAGLSLIHPDSTGLCISSAGLQRLPLHFGQDQKSGCRFLLSSGQLCSSIQKTILFALEESTLLASGLQVYVGALGNSTPQASPESPGDYVPGFVPVITQDTTAQDETTTIDDGCNNLIVGSSYKVLYAKAGDLHDPQSVITGVQYVYETLNLKFPSFLSPASSYSLEITSSVSFIDTSTPSSPVYAQLQPITVDLGDDFFFPFTNHASRLHTTHKLFVFYTICAYFLVDYILN